VVARTETTLPTAISLNGLLVSVRLAESEKREATQAAWLEPWRNIAVSHATFRRP